MTALDRWVERHRLSRWEMSEVLHELSRITPVRTVLEIGTHVGDSLRIWRECLDPVRMVGVQDTDETPQGTAGAKIIRGRSQDPSVHRAVLGVLCNEDVDFLYIDGDHHYGPVRCDLDLYFPLVREGGICVLHDAALEGNDTVEVFKLWPEVRKRWRTKLVWDGRPESRSTGSGIVFR